jgi:hypothetical protein
MTSEPESKCPRICGRIRFKTLCDELLVFSKKHHRDFRSVEIRVKKVVAAFGEKPADKIKPAEIDEWLSKVTKLPAFVRPFATASLPTTQPDWCGSAPRTMDEFAS